MSDSSPITLSNLNGEKDQSDSSEYFLAYLNTYFYVIWGSESAPKKGPPPPPARWGS